MRTAPARSLAAALAALAALALAFAFAACGPSGSDRPDDRPAPGSAPLTRPAPAPRPEPAPPPAARPAPEAGATRAAPPAVDGSFPEACDEYRRTVERLSGCGDALAPGARDSLRALFERQWAGWAKLPEQDRRALAAVCKRASDTVQEAAAAACGW
jgi:hypothetical protein